MHAGKIILSLGNRDLAFVKNFILASDLHLFNLYRTEYFFRTLDFDLKKYYGSP